MKTIAKRIAAAALVLVMAIGALTGCAGQTGNQSKTLLFTYDGREVYLDEAWTYAKLSQATYEAAYAGYFGEEMWTMQVSVDEAGNPVDFQEMVKGSVISQIKQIIILVNKAEELGITLTAEEKAEAKEAAKVFCDKAEGKAILKETGANKNLIIKIYEENALASKVQKEAVKDVDTNVSDDEARRTTVYKLVFPVETTDAEGNTVEMTDAEKAEQLAKAEDALAQIQAGTTTIEQLAESLNLTSTAEETYGAGSSMGGEEFEAAMAALKDGEVASEIFETTQGYVVAKLVAYTDAEATETAKANIIADREYDLFVETYEEWSKELEEAWDYDKDVNVEAWATVRFAEKKVLLTDTTLEIKKGDEVNIGYVGTIDGVEFEGGSTGDLGADLVIGSGQLIDNFEEQLIGAHPGDTVEVNVTFPDNYKDAELSGKDAVFMVTVNGIYE